MATAKSPDSEFVLISFQSGNLGDQRVVGPSTGQFYGYRVTGEEFYVHKNDVALLPHVFIPVRVITRETEVAQRPVPAPRKITLNAEPTAPAPKKVAVKKEVLPTEEVPAEEEPAPFILNLLPGVSDSIAEQLEAGGVDSYEKIVALGVEGLMRYKGVGKSKAEALVAYSQEQTKSSVKE